MDRGTLESLEIKALSSLECRGISDRNNTAEVTRLYRLMLVDEDTGRPRRLASVSEAELVAKSLHEDAANSCLPCLKSASTSSFASDSESGADSPRSAGQLAKHGGPCQHCGTSAVSCILTTYIAQDSKRCTMLEHSRQYGI